MCYCCRKLVISMYFICLRGRIWEAVGGRGRPCSPDWLSDLSKPIRGARPPTASHGLPRPHKFLMWSVWANQGSTRPLRSGSPKHGLSRTRPLRSGSPKSDRPLTHTGRESDPRGYLTDFTAKRIASAGVRERPIGTSDSHGLTDLWGRSDSQICEADLCFGLSDRSHDAHGLTDLRVRSRVGGRSASHAHRASRTSTGRGSTILGLAWLISRLNALLRPVEVRLPRCAWEADRPPTRLRTLTASQIGLSRPPTRPHRSQIGLSDRSDYVTDLTDSFHSYLDRSDVP